jgi:hypothetical protein
VEVPQDPHAEALGIGREVDMALVEADAGVVALEGEDLGTDPEAEDFSAVIFLGADRLGIL